MSEVSNEPEQVVASDGDTPQDSNAANSKADTQTRKIFIGGLNYNTTEEGLTKHFGEFGQIVDVVVMKFPDTKRSRGFGFITFADTEGVDKCQSKRPHVIDGKQVDTKRATPREEFGKPEAGQTVKKVFVGGLKDDHEDEDLREYFSQFGNVTMVTRLTEKDSGKKRGFGFVEFDDYDPVDKTMQKGHHEIKGKRVDVKKAISKQEINSMGGPQAVKLNANRRGGGGGGRYGHGGGRSWGGRGRGGGRGGGRSYYNNHWGGEGRHGGGDHSWGSDQGYGGDGWDGIWESQGEWGASQGNSWGSQDWGQTDGGYGSGYGGYEASHGGYTSGGGYGGGGPMRQGGPAGQYRSTPYGGRGGGGGGGGGGGFRR